MKKLIINKNDCGQRIDKFIKKTFPQFPKSAIYKAIRTKKIKVNGSRCKENLILNLNDVFEVYGFDQFVQTKKIEKNLNFHSKINLRVVYEDENIIIVNKQSGLISHPKKLGEDSLICRIWSYLENRGELILKNENSFMPALCNRLDTNTCGLVIAAKNFKALKNLNELLKFRKIIKTYSCLAEGYFKNKHQILIHWLKKDQLKNKVYLKCFETKNYKKAILEYNVLKQFEHYAKIEVKLYTGRCHQIRAQLAFIGHPIVGDYKYGKCAKTKLKLCSTGLFFDTKNSFFDYLDKKSIKIKSNFD